MELTTITIEVGGKAFMVTDKESIEQMIKETYPKFERTDFMYLVDDLYLHKGFSRGMMYEAIFGHWITYDHAVPQEWFNANLEMIKERGGAVWMYLPGDSIGQPYYDDMAMERLTGMIIQQMIVMDKEMRS